MCASNVVPEYDLPDEGWDRRDEVCDQCARQVYGPLRPTSAGLRICEACHLRNEERYAAMTS